MYHLTLLICTNVVENFLIYGIKNKNIGAGWINDNKEIIISFFAVSHLRTTIKVPKKYTITNIKKLNNILQTEYNETIHAYKKRNKLIRKEMLIDYLGE